MVEIQEKLIAQIKDLLGNQHTQQTSSVLQNLTNLRFPTSKQEEWKYSPFSVPKNSEFFIPSPSTSSLHSDRFFEWSGGYVLRFVNGVYQPQISDNKIEGVVIAQDLPGTEVTQGYEVNIFGYLNEATKGLFGCTITLKDGAVVDKPIFISHYNTETEANWIQPRIRLVIGQHARATFVEGWNMVHPEALVFNGLTEIEVKEEAAVDWISVQKQKKSFSLVNQCRVDVAKQARFSHLVISTGEGYIRNNLEIKIKGEAGDAHMYGLTIGNQKLHADHHTFVNHKVENTTSNQLYKGIFNNRAVGVFNGKILVDQEAQKTNAYQSSKNILLSADAKVFAKPQLEIFADDVKCSHGATIGQLDEEPIFYIRSRGLDENQAKQLLIKAFAGEILLQIENEELREWISAEISQEIDQLVS